MWYPDKVQVEKDRLKGIIYKARISYKMFPEVIFHEVFINIKIRNLANL